MKNDIRIHWNRVAQIPCVICDNPNVTLHHCHGGSMIGRGVRRRAGRKNSDWLVIPLCVRHHVGDMGIDAMGWTVRKWERTFIPQAVILDRLCVLLKVDVWKKAKEEKC